MNPCCSNPHCICGGGVNAPAGWVRRQPGITTRSDALRDLAEAVRVARRFGLSVTCEVTESVVTTL